MSREHWANKSNFFNRIIKIKKIVSKDDWFERVIKNVLCPDRILKTDAFSTMCQRKNLTMAIVLS